MPCSNQLSYFTTRGANSVQPGVDCQAKYSSYARKIKELHPPANPVLATALHWRGHLELPLSNRPGCRLMTADKFTCCVTPQQLCPVKRCRERASVITAQ